MPRKAKITIDQTLVPTGTNESDFPVRLVAANLPQEMLILGGVNAAKADGGDIRFFADEGLSQPLSADICVFKQASQPEDAAAVIYVKLPQIVSATANEFWVYYGDPNLSLIPPESPYGAKDVWNNGYEIVFVAPMAFEAEDALINHVNWVSGYAVSGRNRGILLAHESAISNVPDVHQGLTTDGQYWWAIHTTYIEKYTTLDGSPIVSNTSPFTDVDAACDHLGAGEVYGQYLYVPVEHYASCSDYSNQYIVRYDKDTLAFVGKFDISAQGHEIAALTIDGSSGIIYVVSYCDGSKIFKYDLVTGAYLGSISISPAITYGSPQGITRCGNYFLISVSSLNYLYRVRSDGTRFGGVTKDYTDAGNESVCYDGEYVYWLNGTSPAVLHKYRSIEYSEAVYFGGSYAAQGITHTLPNSGAIYAYVKPNRFFDYNSIFDTSGDGNDWEAWIYSDGRYRARIDVASNTSTLTDASVIHQLGFEWSSSANVNLVVDGTKLSAESDNWIAPASDFYINGGNIGNTTGEGDYYAIFVTNKIRSANWNLLEHNSISSTEAFTSSTTPVDHIIGGRALAFDNTLVREPGLYIPGKKPVLPVSLHPAGNAKNADVFVVCDGNNFIDLVTGTRPNLASGDGVPPKIGHEGVWFPEQVWESEGHTHPRFEWVSPDVSWAYEEFTQVSWFFDVSIYDVGLTNHGPLMLLDEGGSSNGLCIFYRTGPDKFSIVLASGSTDTEYQFSTVVSPGALHRFVFVYNGDALLVKIFMDGALLETRAIASTYASIPSHTSDLGVGGVDSGKSHAARLSVQPAGIDPWSGWIRSFARFRVALDDAAACALTRDPYQFLIPAG